MRYQQKHRKINKQKSKKNRQEYRQKNKKTQIGQKLYDKNHKKIRKYKKLYAEQN